MSILVFDTSSIISLVTNDLLWLVSSLKEKFEGNFYIPNSVKVELVDKPMMTRKFKLEAIMISKVINEGGLEVYAPLNVDDLLLHLNMIYNVGGRSLHIVDRAEVEALALTLRLQADSYVVDERTMRLVIENPYKLKNILQEKLQKRVEVNKKVLKDVQHITKGIKVIRSTELVTVAYEKGLLNKYVTASNSEKDLVDGFLWGLRLRGCAISTEEIDEILRLETERKK